MLFRRLKPTLLGAVAALSLSAALPAHAEWLRAESEHFIVYGDVSEGDLRSYVRKVERFNAVLRLYYPIANEHEAPKLEIYLAQGGADMRRISPSISSGIAGFYSPSAEHVYAVVDLQKSEGDKTLFHEYGHHFMLVYLPGAYPAWFVEGFAEYYSTADLTPGRIRVGIESRGRVNSLRGAVNTWVPMDVLLGRSVGQLRGQQGYGFYAQSWLLMNYMMSTPERQQMLRRYLQLVLGGTESVAAMTEATGRTPQQLQLDVRSYLYLITVYTLQQPIPEAEVAIERLGSGADDLIWLGLRMDRSLGSASRLRNPDPIEAREGETAEQTAERAENLAEARADFLEGIALARSTAARHPGDPMAALVLAKAEMAAGEWAAATTALEPLTAESSTNAEGLRLAGMAMLERAKAEDASDEERAAHLRDARRLLGRSLQADPEDFRTYLALDDSRQGQAGYPNDNDLNTLLAAEEYAPQVRATRYRAAQALVQAGVNQQAIELLEPIANDPHGGSNNATVRTLLNRARVNAGLMPDTSEAPPESDDAGEEPEGS